MKYFVNKFFTGELSDEEVNKIVESYNSYIDSNFLRFSFPLKTITKVINFHDGLISKVELDKANNSALFSYLLGDRQIGYFFLQINYKNVSNFDENELKKNCCQKLEILADEIEIDEAGKYTHRYIFSNQKEMAIHFSDISIKITSAHENDYLTLHDQKTVKLRIIE